MIQSLVVTLSLLCSFDSYNISKTHHIGYKLIFSYINGSVNLKELKFYVSHPITFFILSRFSAPSCRVVLKNNCNVVNRHEKINA